MKTQMKRSSRSETETIRLATFNLRGSLDRWGERKQLLPHAVRKFHPDVMGCQESMTGCQCASDECLFEADRGHKVWSHPFVLDHIQQYGVPPQYGKIGAPLLYWLVWLWCLFLRVPLLASLVTAAPHLLEKLREMIGWEGLIDLYKPLLVPFYCNSIHVTRGDLLASPSEYESRLIDPMGHYMRGAHRVLLKLPSGHRVWFVNVYLNPDVSEDGACRRVEEMERVLSWMSHASARGRADATVIVGDCNTLCSRGEPLFDLMAQHGMRSAHKAFHGHEPAFTWPSGIEAPFKDQEGIDDWPKGVCLDYIWISESLRVHDAGIAGHHPAPGATQLYPSDHFAVWADISCE